MGQALSQWNAAGAVQLAPDATTDLHKGPTSKPFGQGIRPFSEDWLNSCYSVGLMPNTKWQALVKEINSRLADKVRTQLTRAERRQTLFELLGDEYVSQHFPDIENLPHLLEPPRVGWERRQQLRGEGQSWLRLQVMQILRDMGISKYVDLALGLQPQPASSTVDLNTHDQFCKEMSAHLHAFMDQEILKSEQKFLLLLKENPRFEPEVARALLSNHKDQMIAYSSAWNKTGADLVGVGADYQRAHAETLSILDFTDSNSVAHNFYAVLHGTAPKYPSFVSLQSRAVSDSLSGLLQKEPGLVQLVRDRMGGRPLCGSLRQTVWKIVMLDSERRRMNFTNPHQNDFVVAGGERTKQDDPLGSNSHSLTEVEHAVKDRFGKALARGMGELRLRTATVSPVDGMLQNLVHELYKRVQPLSAFKTESRLRETIKTINVVYVHSRKFDAYWIMRLHALQLAFAPSNTNVLSSIRAKLDQLGLMRAKAIAGGLDDPTVAPFAQASARRSAENTFRRRKRLTMSAKFGLDKLGVKSPEWAAANEIAEGHDEGIEGWNVANKSLEGTDLKQLANEAEHIYELAMLLTVLNNEQLFPNWADIYGIVDKTFELLGQVDQEYVYRLREISMINIQFKPNEFTAKEISLDPAKSHVLFDVGMTSQQRGEYERELLGAQTFVRKWLGDLFVSTLRTPAMLFIWDQCFMENWNPQCLVDMCLALLLLVRPFAYRAENWLEMKDVLMTFPQYLYTADIIKAWNHIHRSGNPMEVPEMNRRKPPERKRVLLPPPRIEPYLEIPLPSVGLRDIVVKLVVDDDELINPESLASRFVDTFNVQNFYLFCHLMFGDAELTVQEADIKPSLIGINRLNNRCVISVKYPPHMAFGFYNVMLSNYYDIELELRSFPYLLICANYWLPNGQLATLGWARIPIYRDKNSLNENDVGRGTARSFVAASPQNDPVLTLLQAGDWRISVGRRPYPLHPGGVPEIVTLGDTTDRASVVEELPRPSRRTHYDRTESEMMIASDRPEDFDRQRDPNGIDKVLQNENVDVIGGVKLSIDSELAAYVFNPIEDPLPPRSLNKPSVEPVLPVQPMPQIPANTARHEKLTDPFDVYFDELRFVPDCVYLVRLSCRFLHASNQTDLKDVKVVPDVTSEPRHPRFRAADRLMMNVRDKYELSPRTALLVRVYAVCLPHFQVCVLGNCLIPIFNKNGQLRAGAFQIRIRAGLPQQPIDTIDEASFSPVLSIPAASLLFRVTPHTQMPIAAPAFQERLYQNLQGEFSTAERELMHRFLLDPDYPQTHESAIEFLKKYDWNLFSLTISKKRRLVEYLNQRMDRREKDKPAVQLMLGNLMRYDQQNGIRIAVARAFNLYEGVPATSIITKRVYPNMNTNMFTVAIARVYPGAQIASRAEDPNDVTVYNTHLDANSLYNDPVWHDDFTLIKPTYDARSLLVIQFFGVELRPGIQTPFIINKSTEIGWSAMPLFRMKFANFGHHHLPIFRCDITEKILKTMHEAAGNEDIRRFENYLRTSRSLREVSTSASCIIHVVQDFFDRGMQDGRADVEEQVDLIGRYTEAFQGVDIPRSSQYRRARELFVNNKLKDQQNNDKKKTNESIVMQAATLADVRQQIRTNGMSGRDQEKSLGILMNEFLQKQIPALWPSRYLPIFTKREAV